MVGLNHTKKQKMTAATRKKEWLQLYAKSEMKPLFEEMLETVKEESDKYYDLVGLSQRYNEVNNVKNSGRISFEAAEIATNKIGSALREFIREIEVADFKEGTIEKTELITNPILVLTTNTTEQKYLAAFFKETDFANVQVHLMDDPPAILGYDLLIFDNRDLAECPKDFLLGKLKDTEQALILERIAFMDTMKAKTTCFFIHFGEFLYWVKDNRELFHAANSKFSLFARTKEMLSFINTYRV